MLSRGGTLSALGIKDERFISVQDLTNSIPASIVQDLLTMCDPARVIESDSDFTTLWKELEGIASKI